jgi:histone H3/H4
MTKIEKWVFRRIVKKAVAQDYHHDKKITEMYSIITQEARKEFTEDNTPTLNATLTEWFETALKEN